MCSALSLNIFLRMDEVVILIVDGKRFVKEFKKFATALSYTKFFKSFVVGPLLNSLDS
jgi:hypothetical protein